MLKDMTAGRPGRLIFLFTIPILAGNLFQQVYSLVDTVIVGRTIGQGALAAVGSTSIVAYFFLCFIQGLTSGFAILLGQRFGAGDSQGVRRSVATSLLLCAALSLLLTALTVGLAAPILRLMRTPQDIFAGAYSYVVAIFWGTASTVFYNMLSGILRSLGDSRTPLLFLGVASVLNIALDLLFILALHMGVAGAAWATVASQAVATLLCLHTMRTKFPQLRPARGDWRPCAAEVKAHLRLGFPMGFQMSVMCIGQLAMQVAVNRLGSDCVAGFTAASKVDQLAVQVANAYGVTISSFVAQNYGAGKTARIHRGTVCCLLQSVLLCLAMDGLVFALGEKMVRLFLSGATPRVVGYAMQFLYTVAPCYALLCVLITYRYTLQSMGLGKVPFLACVCELILRTLASLVLAGRLGYFGVCLATPMAWVGAGAVVVTAYLLWKRRLPPQEDAGAGTPRARTACAPGRRRRSGSRC